MPIVGRAAAGAKLSLGVDGLFGRQSTRLAGDRGERRFVQMQELKFRCSSDGWWRSCGRHWVCGRTVPRGS
jgi:hypothetical protein